jgi:hypothetical protein
MLVVMVLLPNELAALVYNLLRASFIDRSDVLRIGLWSDSVPDRLKSLASRSEDIKGIAVNELKGRINRWATGTTQGPMVAVAS